MRNTFINEEVESDSTHEKELVEYQELIYKLGYAPRTDE